MKWTRGALILFLFLSSAILPAVADPIEYPEIKRLAPRDIVFRQIQDSLSQGYRAEQSGESYPDLFLCRWTTKEGDDLFSLAARLSLPYDALASLNGIGRPRAFQPGEVILVPSVAGVFVPDVPRTDLDVLLGARIMDEAVAHERVIVTISGATRAYTFYPGARFYQTERTFFLNIGFRLPLPEGVMTSRFGMRRSPIDGHDRMHEGLDLAAPVGTDVLAARDGTVIAAGNDPVLGLRVIVDHGGGLKTVYGHLSAIFVELNQTVRSGTILASVGSTGMSTGPHLHFEIRLSGDARDPAIYLPGL
ncbi:MAG: M23 family metallopeptidase [Spirochaetales bacterium]|nr:M23 family metallopeptidase [Spirochaetales bacterium]